MARCVLTNVPGGYPLSNVDIELVRTDSMLIVQVVQTNKAGEAQFTTTMPGPCFFRPRIIGKNWNLQVTDPGLGYSLYDRVVATDGLGTDLNFTTAIAALAATGGTIGARKGTYQPGAVLAIPTNIYVVIEGIGHGIIEDINFTPSMGVKIQNPAGAGGFDGDIFAVAAGAILTLRGVEVRQDRAFNAIEEASSCLIIEDSWVHSTSTVAAVKGSYDIRVHRSIIETTVTDEAIDIGTTIAYLEVTESRLTSPTYSINGSFAEAYFEKVRMSKFRCHTTTGASKLRITDCKVAGGTAGSPGIEVGNGGHDDIQIFDNEVDGGTGHAIQIGYTTLNVAHRYQVNNNRMKSTAGHGLYIAGYVVGLTACGNVFSGNAAGYCIETANALYPEYAVFGCNTHDGSAAGVYGPNITTMGGFAGDHGMLTGLADDDHTQYVLRSILTTNGDLYVRSAGVIDRIAVVVPGGASLMNVLGAVQGDTIPGYKVVLDATNPADIAAVAGPGTSLVFSHRDHIHTDPLRHAAITLGGGSDAALSLAGQVLTLADVLTPAEHTAIGDAAPHHAAVTLAVSADVLLGLTGQALSLDTQVKNKVLVGPITGADAAPTFRVLDTADIPDLSGTYSILAHTHAAYLNKDGTVALTGNWNPGAFVIGNYDFTARPAHLDVGDANFELYLEAGGPIIIFDTGLDFLGYVRASNYFNFSVGGVEYLRIGATGILVDHILELTATHGVEVDGCLIKDGLVDGMDVSALGLAADYLRKDGTVALTGNWVQSGVFSIRTAGYMRIGASAAPTNVTAGDLTVERLVVGSNSVAALTAEKFHMATTSTDTANQTNRLMWAAYFINPAAPSSTTFIGHYAQTYYQSAQAGYLIIACSCENYVTGAGQLTIIEGVRVLGLVTYGATASNVLAINALHATSISHGSGAGVLTVGSARGLWVPAPTLQATDVVTTIQGILVENQGGVGRTNAIGLDIEAQSGATTLNFGIRNAGNMVQTGYMRIGAVTAPTNVTNGDLNALRLFVGANAAITGGFIADIAGAVRVGGNLRVTGDIDHDGSSIGFFTTAPATIQTVTGLRGGNAALASLLTALVNYGLIVDSSGI